MFDGSVLYERGRLNVWNEFAGDGFEVGICTDREIAAFVKKR